jgi:hypothetical protein
MMIDILFMDEDTQANVFQCLCRAFPVCFCHIVCNLQIHLFMSVLFY